MFFSDQVVMNAKFYSQDLSQYIWYKACYSYTTNGECDEAYLDLLVRETRVQGNKYEPCQCQNDTYSTNHVTETSASLHVHAK